MNGNNKCQWKDPFKKSPESSTQKENINALYGTNRESQINDLNSRNNIDNSSRFKKM